MLFRSLPCGIILPRSMLRRSMFHPAASGAPLLLLLLLVIMTATTTTVATETLMQCSSLLDSTGPSSSSTSSFPPVPSSATILPCGADTTGLLSSNETYVLFQCSNVTTVAYTASVWNTVVFVVGGSAFPVILIDSGGVAGTSMIDLVQNVSVFMCDVATVSPPWSSGGNRTDNISGSSSNSQNSTIVYVKGNALMNISVVLWNCSAVLVIPPGAVKPSTLDSLAPFYFSGNRNVTSVRVVFERCSFTYYISASIPLVVMGIYGGTATMPSRDVQIRATDATNIRVLLRCDIVGAACAADTFLEMGMFFASYGRLRGFAFTSHNDSSFTMFVNPSKNRATYQLPVLRITGTMLEEFSIAFVDVTATVNCTNAASLISVESPANDGVIVVTDLVLKLEATGAMQALAGGRLGYVVYYQGGAGLTVTLRRVVADIRIVSGQVSTASIMNSSAVEYVATLLYFRRLCENLSVVITDCRLAADVQNGTAPLLNGYFFTLLSAYAALVTVDRQGSVSNLSLVVERSEVIGNMGFVISSAWPILRSATVAAVSLVSIVSNCSRCSITVIDSTARYAGSSTQKPVAQWAQQTNQLGNFNNFNFTCVYRSAEVDVLIEVLVSKSEFNLLPQLYNPTGVLQPHLVLSIFNSTARYELPWQSDPFMMPQVGDVIAIVILNGIFFNMTLTIAQVSYPTSSSSSSNVPFPTAAVMCFCTCDIQSASVLITHATNLASIWGAVISHSPLSQVQLEVSHSTLRSMQTYHAVSSSSSAAAGFPSTSMFARGGSAQSNGSMTFTSRSSVTLTANAFFGFSNVVDDGSLPRPKIVIMFASTMRDEKVFLVRGCNVWSSTLTSSSYSSSSINDDWTTSAEPLLPTDIGVSREYVSYPRQTRVFQGRPLLCRGFYTPTTSYTFALPDILRPVRVNDVLEFVSGGALWVTLLRGVALPSSSIGGSLGALAGLQTSIDLWRIRSRCRQLQRASDVVADDDSEPISSSSVLDNPLQLHLNAFGGKLAYAAGAVVGNLSGMVGGIAMVLWLSENVRRKLIAHSARYFRGGQQQHGWTMKVKRWVVPYVLLLERLLPKTKFPGVLVVVFGPLVQPTMVASTVLAAQHVVPPAASLLSLAVGGFVVVLAAGCTCSYVVLHDFHLRTMTRSGRSRRADDTSAVGSAMIRIRNTLWRAVHAVVEPRAVWYIPKNVTDRQQQRSTAITVSAAETVQNLDHHQQQQDIARRTLAKFGPVFEGYREHRHWYFTVDVLVNGVTPGVLCGVALSVTSSSSSSFGACVSALDWAGASVSALASLSMVLLLWLRPMNSALDEAIAIVCGALNLASAVCTLQSMAVDDSVVNTLNLLSASVSFLSQVLELIHWVIVHMIKAWSLIGGGSGGAEDDDSSCRVDGGVHGTPRSPVVTTTAHKVKPRGVKKTPAISVAASDVLQRLGQPGLSDVRRCLEQLIQAICDAKQFTSS